MRKYDPDMVGAWAKTLAALRSDPTALNEWEQEFVDRLSSLPLDIKLSVAQIEKLRQITDLTKRSEKVDGMTAGPLAQQVLALAYELDEAEETELRGFLASGDHVNPTRRQWGFLLGLARRLDVLFPEDAQ